jgi:flagellar basal-body rod modification protein FlgD
MATTSSTGGLGANGTNLVDRTKLASQSDAYESLDMESFIKLMITEMQNQDPLNPMDNAQMLDQLSSMQSINSTKKLTTTLDSVLLGQNLANAGSLIGKTINGLTKDGEDVTGKVDQATLVGNVPYLNVGDKSVPISNVRYIMPEGATVVDNPDASDS